MSPNFDSNTHCFDQTLTDEEWNAIPRLPDPIETVGEFHADVSPHDLYAALTKQKPPASQKRITAIVAVATTAIAAALFWPGDSIPSAAAAMQEAVANTVVFETGRITVDQSFVASDRQLDQQIAVEFAGSDFRIVHNNQGSIVIGGEGAFTPDRMEIRRIDGQVFIALDDDGWFRAEQRPGAMPLQDLGDEILSATETAQDLDQCDPSTTGLTAYCFSTSDTDLVEALRPGSMMEFLSLNANIRVEIDSTSVTLSTIYIEATDVVVNPASQPAGLVLADSALSSAASFHDLGESVTIVVPTSIADTPLPSASFNEAALPIECQGLTQGAAVLDCLNDHGHTLLAQVYETTQD